MSAPRPETVVRLTDMVGDKVLARLGNVGTELADDLVSRFHQALGFPVEVSASSVPNTVLNVGVGVYTMPNGLRLGIMEGNQLPSLAAGTMSFTTGVITTGANGSFTLPSITASHYVRACIQYNPGNNSLNVTFGTSNAVLASTGVPAVLPGYRPLYIVELQSLGGVGNFNPIANTALIKLVDGSRGQKRSEYQLVASPTTVFTLTQITIPPDRTKFRVLWNGVELYDTYHYTVNSDTSLTTVDTIPANAEMLFVVDP